MFLSLACVIAAVTVEKETLHVKSKQTNKSDGWLMALYLSFFSVFFLYQRPFHEKNDLNGVKETKIFYLWNENVVAATLSLSPDWLPTGPTVGLGCGPGSGVRGRGSGGGCVIAVHRGYVQTRSVVSLCVLHFNELFSSRSLFLLIEFVAALCRGRSNTPPTAALRPGNGRNGRLIKMQHFLRNHLHLILYNSCKIFRAQRLPMAAVSFTFHWCALVNNRGPIDWFTI